MRAYAPITRTLSLVVLAGAAPAPAAPLSAQETSPAALEARAESLHDRPGHWKEAARLYRDAAALRDADDPVAARDLRLAARAAFYGGWTGSVVADLEAASATALRLGDVYAAAMDLADAAWVAVEGNRGTTALEMVARARALAGAPELTRAERSRILRRLGDAAEVIASR